MLRSARFAALALLLGAGSLAAQQLNAPPEATPLRVTLGVLGTGKVVSTGAVGRIGLFHSDLAQVVGASPEATRLARIFARDEIIGRPLILAGTAAIVGGLAAYSARSGGVGMGGREMTAMALGTGALLYGADRLVAAQRALRGSLQVFNERR